MPQFHAQMRGNTCHQSDSVYFYKLDCRKTPLQKSSNKYETSKKLAKKGFAIICSSTTREKKTKKKNKKRGEKISLSKNVLVWYDGAWQINQVSDQQPKKKELQEIKRFDRKKDKTEKR